MKIIAWTIGSIVVLIAALFLGLVQPGGDGVLASVRLQDGSEYMVTQRCNWEAEPYTVAFYMRSANGAWGWCYIDHQAMRWRRVRMEYDVGSDSIIITERGVRRAALDRKRKMFWIDTRASGREAPAPQELRDPEFPFPVTPTT